MQKIVTRVIFLSGAGNGAVAALKAGRNANAVNTDINSARVALQNSYPAQHRIQQEQKRVKTR